jgi:ATP-binding cassette, subfamily B, bacterial
VRDRTVALSTDTQALIALWGIVQDMAMGLRRALEVLDLEPDVVDAADARALPPLGDGIRFEDVSFSYDGTRQTLSHVQLHVRPGTVVAIVGPTGAGKTTLMSLLLRLFDPTSGRVTIGGVDVKDVKLESLRAGVSIALQENLLFAASIRDNIRYAVPGADDARVRAAAGVACADEFIEALAGGYATELGERGGKLSTGQRQRLSIARAIAKDAPITILDEPTAALDAATELAVLRNLREWGRDRVILMITHRLSTIRNADQIVFMDEGRIVESGTHAQLMHTDGRYSRMMSTELTIAAADG